MTQVWYVISILRFFHIFVGLADARGIFISVDIHVFVNALN